MFNNLNSVGAMTTRARKGAPHQTYNAYRNGGAAGKTGVGTGAYQGYRTQTQRPHAQAQHPKTSNAQNFRTNSRTGTQNTRANVRTGTQNTRAKISSPYAQASNRQVKRSGAQQANTRMARSKSTASSHLQATANQNVHYSNVRTPNSRAKISNAQAQQQPRYVSRRLGDIQKQERTERMRKQNKAAKLRVVIVAIVFVLFVGGGIALYLSPAFEIENVKIEGAEHLTEEEMIALAAVPSDTTLLRVNTSQIQKNCERDAWIESISVRKDFPNTLTLVVTEREIAAVVEVPSENSYSTRLWAISSDDMWLMPIPDKDSEAGQAISQQIYDDVENVMRIVDVPYSVVAEIGTYCTDSNIDNAISIVSSMTTELKDEVTKVSATDSDSTTLTLSNGVEVSFGTSDNLREKERIVLELLEEHEGSISYINVRSVNNPTWRSL